jgi:hypothetical protein
VYSSPFLEGYLEEEGCRSIEREDCVGRGCHCQSMVFQRDFRVTLRPCDCQGCRGQPLPLAKSEG